MQIPPTGHDPVLMEQVLDLLRPAPGAVYVDCTLGRAGHASVIASRLGPTGTLIGLDVDPRNLEFAREQLRSAPCTVRLFHANFAEMRDVFASLGSEIQSADLILADLGLSTNQLFDEHYGLSFATDMPLDMRIDPRLDRKASDLVNGMREDDLANVLYELAQEHYSRRIARKIGEARRLSPILTTGRLAELVRDAIPKKKGPPEKIDPATRTFMALRMKVNQELENLGALLKQAPTFLKPRGRFGVISFHSMEDRPVKQAFRMLEQTGQAKIITPKPVVPTDAEADQNPRARSGKLRVIEKT